jgi:hypothetical protein
MRMEGYLASWDPQWEGCGCDENESALADMGAGVVMRTINEQHRVAYGSCVRVSSIEDTYSWGETDSTAMHQSYRVACVLASIDE